jgi:tetratricopeptide (TPR) repeat protein
MKKRLKTENFPIEKELWQGFTLLIWKRMRILLVVAMVPMAITAPLLAAPEPLSTMIAEGIQSLEDGVPVVAVAKLQNALKENLTPEQRRTASAKLAEALLACGRVEDAMAESARLNLREPLLAARIYIAAERWAEALALYEKETPNPVSLLGRAECLYQLGKTEEAIGILENAKAQETVPIQLRLAEFYLDAERLKDCEKLLASISPVSPAAKKWKQYAEARLMLAQGRPAYAFGRFEALQREPHYIGKNLLIGAILGMAEARVQLSGLTAADDLLEQFIWKYPAHYSLGLVFKKLDEIYAGEESPSFAELQKWTQSEPAIRSGYATHYLARGFLRENRKAEALQVLEEFESRFPEHDLLAETLLMRGQLQVNVGKFDIAERTFERAMRATQDAVTRAHIEMSSAIGHFEKGEFVMAATQFRNAGERSPDLWEHAVVCSALSWLNQGNLARFIEDYEELSRKFPDSLFRRDLILEEGLLEARKGDARAEVTLRRFIKDFPDSPRIAEARLALAELRFTLGDARGAENYLKVVNENPAPVPTAAQADYLAIFVASQASPRDDERVIELCRYYLDRYPDSPREAEVRMKLGNLFFRRDDFASAQIEFERLARENETSPLVETALYLAGQSSMKSMSVGGVDRATELFEEVAKLKGPLKLYARLQQALAQDALGKKQDANLIYDTILASNPTPELKFAALSGKADNLTDLGKQTPALYNQALDLYEQILMDQENGAVWRMQALYKKGRCLMMLKRQDEALAAYYDVLKVGLSQPEDYFWFYKAGFDAGRLCEERAQWQSAIGIYQKMADLEGPRAEEAKARLTQLRLEHFIWE